MQFLSPDIAKRFANLDGQVVPVGDAGSSVSSQEIVAVAGEKVVNLRVEGLRVMDVMEFAHNHYFELPFFSN